MGIKFLLFVIFLLLAIILSLGISEDEITTPDKIESDNILTPIQIPYLNKPIIESSAVEVLPPEFSEPSVIKVDVIREDLSGIIFDIEFPEPEFSLVEKNNRVFTKVDLPTNNVLKKPGKPNLPYQVVIVSIPFNSDVLVSSSVENEKTFSDILPYPTPKLVLNYDSMGIPYPEYVYLYDESIYNGKNFYPQILTEIETKGSVRGYPVVRIAIYPLQYNPQNNSLSFYQKIRIKIDFIGGEVKRDIIEKDSLSQSEEEFLRAFSDTVVNKNTFRYFRHKEETNSFDNFTAYDLYQLGDVYKIFIKDPGVYKVSSDWLADRGINLIGTESKSIKLYTGDHIDLIEELPSTEEPNDGISEVPLIFYDGGDGRFDRGDYFVFYGFGASFIDDNWHINSKKFHKCKYTEYSVYFLTSNTDGDGSRYTDVDLSPQGGEEKIDFYNYREHHEYETIGAGQGQYKNPPEGDNWYWTSINAGLTWEYIFQLKNIDFSRNMVLGFRFQGKATREYETVYHHVRIYINYIDYEHLIYENDNWKDNEWIEAEVDVSGGILRDGDNIIYIQNVSDKSKFSDFWVDWLDFLYWRKSKPEDNKIEFGTYNITEGKKLFEVGPFNSSDLVAFNRIHNNKIAGKIENRSDGYYFIFADEIKTELKIYDVYQLDEFGEPVDVVKDQPTELHSKANGADGIYITYDYYYDIIKPLADLHRKDGYDVMVIKAEDVYEEFGKGQFDPTAMRNLIFYAYNNWAKEPLYITLVGSCTKDPMDHWHRQKDNARIYLHHGMNTMPVHNEFMGGEEYYGWVPADVWFVCIDYGDPEALMPDLAISRISAYDKEYTAWVVEKTIKYISKPKYGDWRTSITLCADNGLLGEEGNFSEDSEKLIRDILPYGFLYKKLYLESLNFPEEWLDPEHKGQRQSWTRLYLTPKLYTNFGSLFTQFSGHGSYNIWCHEYLFIDWRVHPHNPFQEWQKTITVEPFGSFIPSDVLKLQNYDEYPFVMMMSCNLGHIDLEVEVMTEKLTFIKNKGALMAEGEARLGYENTQDKFNRGVMSRIFPNKKVPDERMAFSIPFWLAKLDADMSTRIQRNLIGDCMVKVGFPTKKIEVASDKSLYKRGEVIKIDGTIIDDSEFNGYAIVKITDNILYCKIDSTSFPYSYRDRVLTKTKVKVEGGRFSANIPIPYDTGDGEEPTKVAFNVYAYDENRNIEAVLNENKRVDIEGWGGSSDSQGPQISIRAGNEDFIDGDFVPKKCPLWIDLQDESGILLADSDDIKEPISVEVTGVKGTIDVTYLFTSEVDDYCKGSIFLYVDIPDGERQIKVTAYDIYNNKTTAVVNVRTEKGLTLKDVMNCPNPVKSDTYFTFSASKMVDEVKIMIFTVSGRHIKTIEKIHLLPGYNEIYWDCLDDNGRSIANGVYLYKITARTDNEKCEVYEKLIMMR